MAHPRYTNQEISQRGRGWYERSIHSQIDEEHNKNKALIINIESDDYEIDDDGLTAAHRALAKQPNAILHWMRIGYPTYAKARAVLLHSTTSKNPHRSNYQ